MNYVSMHDCPEPSIVARALMRNDPANENVSLDEFNCQVLAAIGTIHKWRRDPNAKDSDNDPPVDTAGGQLTQSFELTSQHPDPTSVTPLRNLVTRLQAYLEMVDTTPPRLEPSPGIRNTKMSDVTAQVSVELGSASGVPRHQQTVSMANHERNTFDRNLASHHQLIDKTCTGSINTAHGQDP
jgi:hypothetical protein